MASPIISQHHLTDLTGPDPVQTSRGRSLHRSESLTASRTPWARKAHPLLKCSARR